MRSKMPIVRILIADIGFLATLFGAWWIPLVVMFVLALRYSAWEVPLLGLTVDLLFLPAVGFPYPVPFFTIFGLVVVWVFEPLRRQFLVP